MRIPRLPNGVRLPTSFTDQDATELVAAIADAYGWTCLIYNRQTVEAHLTANRAGRGRHLSTGEWERIRRSPAWTTLPTAARNAAAQPAAQHATAAIRQAGLECATCRAVLTAPPAETFGHCARCLLTVGLAEIQQRPCPLTGATNPHDFTDSPVCRTCGIPAPQHQPAEPDRADRSVVHLRPQRRPGTPAGNAA